MLVGADVVHVVLAAVVVGGDDNVVTICGSGAGDGCGVAAKRNKKNKGLRVASVVTRRKCGIFLLAAQLADMEKVI